MKTLLELIDELGVAVVAADLGVHTTYIAHLRRGRRPVSAAILARARGCYGDLLDVDQTLIELRAEDYERGQASATPPSAPSDSQPTEAA